MGCIGLLASDINELEFRRDTGYFIHVCISSTLSIPYHTSVHEYRMQDIFICSAIYYHFYSYSLSYNNDDTHIAHQGEICFLRGISWRESYSPKTVYLERSLEIIANLFHCAYEITVMRSVAGTNPQLTLIPETHCQFPQ